MPSAVAATMAHHTPHACFRRSNNEELVFCGLHISWPRSSWRIVLIDIKRQTGKVVELSKVITRRNEAMVRKTLASQPRVLSVAEQKIGEGVCATYSENQQVSKRTRELEQAERVAATRARAATRTRTTRASANKKTKAPARISSKTRKQPTGVTLSLRYDICTVCASVLQ